MSNQILCMQLKLRKKLCALAVLLISLLICGMSASAAVKIKSTKYKDKGQVEVNFTTKVRYKNAKLTVKDAKGKKVAAVFTEKDDDDLTFRIRKVKEGSVYSFTVSGIRKLSEKKFGTLKGKIRIPSSKGKVRVKKTEYDTEDQQVEFEFAGIVKWNRPIVSITDGYWEYAVKIDDKSTDDLEVSVRQLKKGRKYNYRISGICYKNGSAFMTVSGSFTA